MELHFFTVNDVQDYRKRYPAEPSINRLFNDLRPQTVEDFDQAVFFQLSKIPYDVSGELAESKICGETGINGLRLDFNFGLRLDIPEGNFRVKISDFETGKIFLDKYISGGRVISLERYFIRWHVEIFLDEEKIFTHTLNLEGQNVALMMNIPALGDTIAMLPYLREFKKIHRCNLFVVAHKNFRELISKFYPDITLIDKIDFKTYATYYPTMLLVNFPLVPVDTRLISLNRMGGMLLGINYLPPKAEFKPTEPPITKNPYVCIAVQAFMARKCWLYPNGWDIVVDYLKSLGYRVFCIDKNAKEENNGFTISKPECAEDFTGDISLIERANMIYHAEFFIGLSSGLAWIADAVNCPVVMIAGFTLDWHEFYTPYRVANRKVCNGCFNDCRVFFLDKDGCPYHKNTPREFECQKKISPRMVIDAIERLIIDKKLTPPALKEKFL